MELVTLLPLLFYATVLLFAQATIWWHAAHIAQATAADALAVTRVQGGNAADGRAEAERVLDQLGRGPLRSAHISVIRRADRAEVRITGIAFRVVPFVNLPVRAHAVGPVEQFRPNDQAAP